MVEDRAGRPDLLSVVDHRDPEERPGWFAGRAFLAGAGHGQVDATETAIGQRVLDVSYGPEGTHGGADLGGRTHPGRSWRMPSLQTMNGRVYPKLWNYVRREVDARATPGQFILTASATPAGDHIRHSAAGRFGRIQMPPWLSRRSVEVWAGSLWPRCFPGKASAVVTPDSLSMT